MNDGSAKTLMVDERQTVREVLDNLFEKTHCDCNVDWSLCETNHELQLGELLRYGIENTVTSCGGCDIVALHLYLYLYIELFISG